MVRRIVGFAAWRPIILVGIALSIVGTLYYGYCSFYQQINNFIRLNGVARELSIEKERNGRHPAQFDRQDFWGRPILYQTDGRTFLLVSYGADGVPDRSSYAIAELGSPPVVRRDVCLERDRDTIFIGEHLVQGCAK